MALIHNPRFDTPLTTEYANAALEGVWGFATAPEAYTGCETLRDLDACRVTEARHEDRLIAEMTGATSSEVWA